MTWFCTHCGKPRPERPNVHQIDGRYTTVVCRTGNETDPDGEPYRQPLNEIVITGRGILVGREYPGVRTRAEALAYVDRRIARERNRDRERTASKPVPWWVSAGIDAPARKNTSRAS